MVENSINNKSIFIENIKFEKINNQIKKNYGILEIICLIISIIIVFLFGSIEWFGWINSKELDNTFFSSAKIIIGILSSLFTFLIMFLLVRFYNRYIQYNLESNIGSKFYLVSSTIKQLGLNSILEIIQVSGFNKIFFILINLFLFIINIISGQIGNPLFKIVSYNETNLINTQFPIFDNISIGSTGSLAASVMPNIGYRLYSDIINPNITFIPNKLGYIYLPKNIITYKINDILIPDIVTDVNCKKNPINFIYNDYKNHTSGMGNIVAINGSSWNLTIMIINQKMSNFSDVDILICNCDLKIISKKIDCSNNNSCVETGRNIIPRYKYNNNSIVWTSFNNLLVFDSNNYKHETTYSFFNEWLLTGNVSSGIVLSNIQIQNIKDVEIRLSNLISGYVLLASNFYNFHKLEYYNNNIYYDYIIGYKFKISNIWIIYLTISFLILYFLIHIFTIIYRPIYYNNILSPEWLLSEICFKDKKENQLLNKNDSKILLKEFSEQKLYLRNKHNEEINEIILSNKLE